eukprot:CAMPEP_0178450924 /NCGR_PEP_ID=MMETSP0689_2-20121128/43392_1 /TAXON_ID=160604 /ORGANISM="Amphidinium massartii, Strain CS-259" /LENGTH=47 /DNA_ID= /DNA_START= /DNA_END= /DNA_ORIENTATION=
MSARSALPLTANATNGVQGKFVSAAGATLSSLDAAASGSTRNSSRLL